MAWPTQLGKRVRDGLLAILGVAAIGLAVYLVLRERLDQVVPLRMTAGREEGTRHWIAQELVRGAVHRAIAIDLKPMPGSEEALRAMESRQIDIALVQGGFKMAAYPGLRQVAALYIEPLHLLVKQEIYHEVARNLNALRDKKVNLGEHGSGTYLLATEVMEFLNLQAGRNFTEMNRSYADLQQETCVSALPDAVFTVSTLPSPLAHRLVTEHDFRLVALPFRKAFALRALYQNPASSDVSGARSSRIDHRHVYDAVIPESLYETEPSEPPKDIHTLGTQLLLVARKDIATTTIRRLLEVVYNSPFSQVCEPPLDAKLLDSPPELPWHEGTMEYTHRNSPLITGDVIDLFEKWVSILGVLIGGLLCVAQWLRRRYRWRRERSFEAYVRQVTQVERGALALARAPALDLPALLQLQDELTRIKGEALEQFALGKLEGEELMSGFLVHASDTRDFLMRLILHQRDNLEETARAQSRPAETLWNEAVGELNQAATGHEAIGP